MSSALDCSSSSSFPIPTSMDIPPDLAKHLFYQGATLILLDLPPGSEFGVDYKSWTVGEKFKGLKMIPPGVHFLYYSIGKAPRIGFFHHFSQKEIMIRQWDKATEDLRPLDVSPHHESHGHLQSLDPFLGPYPFDTYRCWFGLSNRITSSLVDQLNPVEQRGRISSQAELVTMETELMESSGSETTRNANIVDRQHPTRLRFVDEQGLPIMRVRPGFQVRYHDIPLPQMREVSQRTANSMDASDRLEKLLENFEHEKELLGEIQFAFICFLMGQVYEGFEQWKRLVHLLCSCSRALVTRPDLFLDFMMTLHFQLKECPEDFFVDIVSRNNFLTITLAHFFSNVDVTEDVSIVLKEKAHKFKKFLTKRFKWDFESEDNPTIVSLDQSVMA